MALVGTGGIENSTGLNYADRGAGSFYAEMLKDYYLDITQEVMIFPDTTYNLIGRKTPQRFDGKLAYFTLHKGRGNGRSSSRPGAKLPDAGAELWDQAIVPIRHFRSRIKIDGMTKVVSDSARGAWLEGTAQEMEYAMKHAKRDLNRQLHGDGTGRLAMVTAHSAGVLTLTVPNGYVQSGTMDNAPSDSFYVGQRLAGFDPSGNIDATGVVTAINSDTTITVTTDQGGGSAWDNVVSGGTGWVTDCTRLDLPTGGTTEVKNTAYLAELMGFGAMFSDQDPSVYWESEISNFQNIPSTEDFNAATLFFNGGTKRALTLQLMQQTRSRLRKTVDNDVDLYITSFETYDTYHNLLEQQREYQTITSSAGAVSGMDGAIDDITYGRKPIIPDRDCARNRIYGVPLWAIHCIEARPWTWMSEDGDILSRMTDEEAYQATLMCDSNLYVTWRQALLNIGDLIEA
jgi:hypothetical protein